jgi:DNA-directed RNA polymerase
MALTLCNRRVGALGSFRDWNWVPVTQDASASAYQIMSYLLLNKQMAMLTNLIPSPSGEIQDLYVYLREELRFYLRENRDILDIQSYKFEIVESQLTRKLVKTLFMPLIYGKSVITMAGDIRESFGSLLNMKESYHIARLCRAFWVEKYPDIVNLMKLINLIGWFCAFRDEPVKYSIPLFTTNQDYMRSIPVQIKVYDRQIKKERRVTLRVPTNDRDTRKTGIATCVNFIHQKDAFIAMKVVERLSAINALVYTVHDNFITTPDSAAKVPPIYTKVFMEMDAPLRYHQYVYNAEFIG